MDPAFGLARAEIIRTTMCERPVETSAGSVSISMSFGLLLSQEWGCLSVPELLHEVDTALYGAKAAGRNSVKVAVPRHRPGDKLPMAPELMRRKY